MQEIMVMMLYSIISIKHYPLKNMYQMNSLCNVYSIYAEGYIHVLIKVLIIWMMLSSYLKPDLFLDNKFHLISIISYAGDNNEWNGLCHFRCASFLLSYMIHYNMRKVPQKVIYTEQHNSLFSLHWTRYLLFLVITCHQKWFEVHIKLCQSFVKRFY